MCNSINRNIDDEEKNVDVLAKIEDTDLDVRVNSAEKDVMEVEVTPLVTTTNISISSETQEDDLGFCVEVTQEKTMAELYETPLYEDTRDEMACVSNITFGMDVLERDMAVNVQSSHIHTAVEIREKDLFAENKNVDIIFV